MKVRITDLLDQYYDKSVKLDLPAETLPQEPALQPQRRRAQKPLLVAATLMLVVTGITGLAFGFQRLGTSGHALAGEESPASILEEAPALTAELTPEPEVPVEVTPEPTAEAREDTEDEVYETIPVEVSGYTQQGNKLQFSLKVHDVPVGYTVELQPGDEYSNIINEAQVEDVTGKLLGEGWEESGERCINATVELTEEGGPLVFRVACHDEEDNWVFTETTSIPVASFTNFVSDATYGIYEFVPAGIDPPTITVTRIEVQPRVLWIKFRAPVEDYETAVTEKMGEWMYELRSKVDSNLLCVTMKDGSTADLEISSSIGNRTQDDPEPDGSCYFELAIDLAEPIDPLEIDTVEFRELAGDKTDPFRWDLNGDGMLTARLDLPLGDGGTVTRLTIDPDTGDYTWYYTNPELEQTLYDLSPEGNLNEALHDISFNAGYTEIFNDLLYTYGRDTELFFYNNASMTLNAGDVNGFTDGEFWVTANLSSPAEDAGLDITGFVPNALQIGGETYYFE